MLDLWIPVRRDTIETMKGARVRLQCHGTDCVAQFCDCVCFLPSLFSLLLSVSRPNKVAIQQARSRRVPLFNFRHHQHLLDHLQEHIEQSPKLTETGEAELDEEENPLPRRRSHPTVQ